MEATHSEETSLGKSNSSAIAWNLLTVLLLAGVVLIAGLSLLIYVFPHSIFNPFPLPTLPAAVLLPTQSPTPRVVLPPTWTPTPLIGAAAATITPDPAFTAMPSKTSTSAGFTTPVSTLRPTQTPTQASTQSPSLVPTQTSTQDSTSQPVQPTETQAAAPTQPALAEFSVQSGSPMAIPNITYPDLGCDWMGVGGQVVDASGEPVTGLKIQLGGELGGIPIEDSTFSLTGDAPQYGQAGYEFMLADEPIASEGSLWVQLLNQAGTSLSAQILFDTYEDCESNLIVINFEQVR